MYGDEDLYSNEANISSLHSDKQKLEQQLEDLMKKQEKTEQKLKQLQDDFNLFKQKCQGSSNVTR